MLLPPCRCKIQIWLTIDRNFCQSTLLAVDINICTFISGSLKGHCTLSALLLSSYFGQIRSVHPDRMQRRKSAPSRGFYHRSRQLMMHPGRTRTAPFYLWLNPFTTLHKAPSCSRVDLLQGDAQRLRADAESRAKSLECQSNESTVRPGSRASRSSFSWINFPHLAKTNKPTCCVQNKPAKENMLFLVYI